MDPRIVPVGEDTNDTRHADLEETCCWEAAQPRKSTNGTSLLPQPLQSSNKVEQTISTPGSTMKSVAKRFLQYPDASDNKVVNAMKPFKKITRQVFGSP